MSGVTTSVITCGLEAGAQILGDLDHGHRSSRDKNGFNARSIVRFLACGLFTEF